MTVKQFELIVIHGKKRVGKTRLVLEAVRDREHVYYLAVEEDNLRHFKRVASKLAPKISYSQEDWETYFNFLKGKLL
ncbi:ATP-binding protein [Geoglobus acetivorans]|uniref:ATP-binding protein n=1 Tax=Geoglobus acetivorans TaxID=565033 RepID=A0ABZ3H8L0_GEOAI